MNALDVLASIDWITSLLGILGKLSSRMTMLSAPTPQWQGARALLRRHRIGVYAVSYRSDKVMFNVRAGISYLAWCTLDCAGYKMLGPCPPNPRRVYAARNVLLRGR